MPNVFSKVIDQFYARNVFGVTATDKRKDKKEAICAEIVGEVIAESTAESLTPTVYVHDVEFKSKRRERTRRFSCTTANCLRTRATSVTRRI